MRIEDWLQRHTYQKAPIRKLRDSLTGEWVCVSMHACVCTCVWPSLARSRCSIVEWVDKWGKGNRKSQKWSQCSHKGLNHRKEKLPVRPLISCLSSAHDFYLHCHLMAPQVSHVCIAPQDLCTCCSHHHYPSLQPANSIQPSHRSPHVPSLWRLPLRCLPRQARLP